MVYVNGLKRILKENLESPDYKIVMPIMHQDFFAMNEYEMERHLLDIMKSSNDNLSLIIKAMNEASKEYGRNSINGFFSEYITDLMSEEIDYDNLENFEHKDDDFEERMLEQLYKIALDIAKNNLSHFDSKRMISEIPSNKIETKLMTYYLYDNSFLKSLKKKLNMI